jgi:predicted DCC family thiol-disulfide oxidoreductase YuxK
MKTTALYDGTCSLCKETKRIFTKIDWLHKVEWVSLQEFEKSEQNLTIDQATLRKEIHVITHSGKMLKGFYAVRYMLLLFPSTIIIGALLHLPFVPLIGNPVYQWVAKNRHKLLKRKCEDGSCSL